jgi:hypothetical protein
MNVTQPAYLLRLAAPNTIPTMHDVDVTVTSPETAQDGVAEFSADGRMFGFTVLEDGEIALHLLPEDGEPIIVGARSMMVALQRAGELLKPD